MVEVDTLLRVVFLYPDSRAYSQSSQVIGEGADVLEEGALHGFQHQLLAAV